MDRAKISEVSQELDESSSKRPPRWMTYLPLLVLLPIGLWAYAHTLGALVQTWSSEPDYSHGFLVPFIAVWLMWMRRSTCPPLAMQWSWGAVILLVASLVLRTMGAAWFVESLDGWSLVLWIAGLGWLIAGTSWTRWALPAIVFLLFMIPLPFRIEYSLSQPLQGLATRGSVWLLQTLGQPAIAEGNVILLGDHALEVAQACAGLRIFLGIGAIAYAGAIAASRNWLERLILLGCALPVAVAANVLRIVITAICIAHGSESIASAFAHDAAGWLMIPLAILMIGFVYQYLQFLFVDAEPLRVSDVVDRQRAR